MPNVKDCPGFESFGADVQQAREAVGMSRRELAERVGIDPRYLANIELCGTIPSVPVVMQLIRLCKLPAKRYFNSCLIREDSGQATSCSSARKNTCLSSRASLTGQSKSKRMKKRGMNKTILFCVCWRPQGASYFLRSLRRKPLFCGNFRVVRAFF